MKRVRFAAAPLVVYHEDISPCQEEEQDSAVVVVVYNKEDLFYQPKDYARFRRAYQNYQAQETHMANIERFYALTRQARQMGQEEQQHEILQRYWSSTQAASDDSSASPLSSLAATAQHLQALKSASAFPSPYVAYLDSTTTTSSSASSRSARSAARLSQAPLSPVRPTAAAARSSPPHQQQLSPLPSSSHPQWRLPSSPMGCARMA